MSIYINEEIILYNIANMHLWSCKCKTCKDGSYLAKYYNGNNTYICWLRIYELSESEIEVRGRYCNSDIYQKFDCTEVTELEILSTIEQLLLINFIERVKKWII